RLRGRARRRLATPWIFAGMLRPSGRYGACNTPPPMARLIRFRPRYVVPRIFIERVPRGVPGTLATARLIARMVRHGAKDFYVRQKAIDIYRQCRVRAKDRMGEIRSLFDWVRRHIRYTRDIFRVELLHTARRLLELRAGDCDDMTILLGSMLMSTGHP